MLIIAWQYPQSANRAYYIGGNDPKISKWTSDPGKAKRFNTISDIFNEVGYDPSSFKSGMAVYQIIRLTEKITITEEIVLG